MPIIFLMVEDKNLTAGAVGIRLRERREWLKMTQAELSSRTGIGGSSLSDFENGKREPTLSQLKKLASSLEADVAGLLSATQSPAATVRWRARPKNAEVIEARFLRLCRQYRDLERWTAEEQPIQMRRAEQFPAGPRDVELLARRVRHEMELGNRPGLVLQAKLEDDYGLKVFHVAVEPSGTAACTASVDCGTAVLLNSLNSRARRTFDLAHEFFHVLTWGLPVHFSTEDVEESLADRFAATLLIPEETLREAVERRIRDSQITLANMCELARDFNVSVDALLWRMHNVYRWPDPDKTRELIVRARGLLSAYRDFTPDGDEVAEELPQRYKSLALQALRSGTISTGRFAEYMGLRRWQAMKYAQGAPGDEAISLPTI